MEVMVTPGALLGARRDFKSPVPQMLSSLYKVQLQGEPFILDLRYKCRE